MFEIPNGQSTDWIIDFKGVKVLFPDESRDHSLTVMDPQFLYTFWAD